MKEYDLNDEYGSKVVLEEYNGTYSLISAHRVIWGENILRR